jgi:hypothetical protein
MDRREFLETQQKQHAAWEKLLGEIKPAEMLTPGVVGEWSVKDLIAHVTWYEREMLPVLAQRALVGSELWDEPLDVRNQTIYEQNKDRTLDEVLEDSRQVYAALWNELQTLSDEDLIDPGRFKEWPPEWPPWELLASNTFQHYEEHIPELQVWVETHS